MTLNGKWPLFCVILPNLVMALILHYFTEFVYDVVAKQLLGLPRFQNLLLIVYDHINTICAIIQRLFRKKQTLITRFDGRKCIDDWMHCIYCH